jgi:rhamnosyltransferase
MASTSKVVAVIVTFLPNLNDFLLLLDSIEPQVDSLVLVNNGSDFDLKSLEQISKLGTKANVIELSENLGVAYAQNIGIDWANKQKAQFALLLDQDSIPHADMVIKLLNALEHPSNIENAIAIGPSYIDPRTSIQSYFMVSRLGLPFRYKPHKKIDPLASVKTAFLISSGSLISLEKLTFVGGMRSNYFIDHVDTEWCLRARSKGYDLIGLHSAVMEHSLGDNVKKVWFFYFRSVAYHSPLRDYYMFRNTLLMIRDTPTPFFWAAFLLLRLFQFALYFLLFAEMRTLRLRMMLLGLSHGLARIDGKLNMQTRACVPIPRSPIDPTDR